MVCWGRDLLGYWFSWFVGFDEANVNTILNKTDFYKKIENILNQNKILKANKKSYWPT